MRDLTAAQSASLDTLDSHLRDLARRHPIVRVHLAQHVREGRTSLDVVRGAPFELSPWFIAEGAHDVHFAPSDDHGPGILVDTADCYRG